MKISETLAPELVNLHLQSKRKLEVAYEMVDLLSRSQKVRDKLDLLQAILNRESLQSTVVDTGIAVSRVKTEAAIPHARIRSVDELIVALGVARDGVDFGAYDGSPVRIIFMLACPERDGTNYLKILAQVFRLLSRPGFKEDLLAAATPEEAIQAIAMHEEAVEVAAVMT